MISEPTSSHGLEQHVGERVHRKKGDKIRYQERRIQPRTRAEGECEVSRDLATTAAVATQAREPDITNFKTKFLQALEMKHKDGQRALIRARKLSSNPGLSITRVGRGFKDRRHMAFTKHIYKESATKCRVKL